MDTGDQRLESAAVVSRAGKGFFPAEIEGGCAAGDRHRRYLHSLRPPTVLPGLVSARTARRGDARDAFLGKDGRTFDELPAQVSRRSLRTAWLAACAPT